MGKTRNTGKLATQIQFDNSNNLVIGNSASSSFNTSGSVNAIGGITGSIFGIGNPTSFSSSISSNLISIQSVTASNIARLSNLETKSSSVDISVSSINTFTSSNANTSLNSKTGSYATTGSNTFFGTQTYSGSVYIANDLVVQGSSSIQYISASSVSIGTNIVQLNTANPAIRFAGLSIIDSGSVGGSGSFLYDSKEDEFLFVHRGNGINVTSSHFVTGPETYDSLGNELYLTCNILSKGTGKEHLVDSCIFDNGTTTCVKNNLVVGVGNFTTCLTFGDWTTSTNILSSNKPNEQGAYIRAAVSTAANPTYAFQDDRCTGMYRDSTNALGFATSGSARMTISCTGLVGIGATPLTATSAILQIEQAQGNIFAIRRADCSNTGNARVLFQAYNASGTLQNTGIVEAGLDNSTTNGYLGFYAGTAAMNMKITSNGRVGIGTTPDYGTLSIFCTDNSIIGSTEWGSSTACNVTMAVYNGSQCVGSASGLRLITRNSGASIWNIYNISQGATSGDLVFGNGANGTGTEKMRITNGGMVGIGTTPLSWGSGTTALQIGTTGALWNRASDGLVVLVANSYFNGTSDIQICTGYSNRIYFNNGQTNFERAASTSAAGTTPWATSMIISATGITCFACTICAPNYAGGTSYTIDFVVVAGGGGGGGAEMSNGYGGGGGAGGGGGYLASSISVNCGSTYPIVVGTGGIGGCSRLAPDGSGLPGAPGTFSSAFGFAAAGGGAGAGDEGGQACNNVACTNGGSGGGQGGDGGGTLGIAVIGQGNNAGPAISRTGGGGGGAGATPGGATGGTGRQWYDGNYYAGGGGGGGGGNNQVLSSGGAGGGGQGSRSYPGGGTSGEAGGQACAGAACSGGGGGGAGAGYLQGGQAGGSGVVIIRYFGGTRASGGTITSSGGYTYHKFGAAGTFTA